MNKKEMKNKLIELLEESYETAYPRGV